MTFLSIIQTNSFPERGSLNEKCLLFPQKKQLGPSDAATATVPPLSAGQGKKHREIGGTAALMGCWGTVYHGLPTAVVLGPVVFKSCLLIHGFHQAADFVYSNSICFEPVFGSK